MQAFSAERCPSPHRWGWGRAAVGRGCAGSVCSLAAWPGHESPASGMETKSLCTPPSPLSLRRSDCSSLLPLSSINKKEEENVSQKPETSLKPLMTVPPAGREEQALLELWGTFGVPSAGTTSGVPWTKGEREEVVDSSSVIGTCAPIRSGASFWAGRLSSSLMCWLFRL